MKVAEERILWWMCEFTRRNKIKNEDICGKVGVILVEARCGKQGSDGSDIWWEEAQMLQCRGVSGWLWTNSRKVEVNWKSIEKRWLDKKWHNYDLS